MLARAAMQQGVQHGRGGLGSIYVWASGNGGDNVRAPASALSCICGLSL